MSHNAYVQGLLENGCEVDILMAKDSWGKQDNKLSIWEEARYRCYPSTSPQDKIRFWVRKLFPSPASDKVKSDKMECTLPEYFPDNQNFKAILRSKLKELYYRCFPKDPLYPMERVWLKKASHFQSSSEYDLVISNSSPAASHKLVLLLLQAKRISFKRWVQIWEDPWYADLYGSRDEAVFQEEHALLSAATEVYYVSPLTLEYQKELFPDCKEKMKHLPLPYLVYTEDNSMKGSQSFGYFGDFYSRTRNLLPFYEALRESGCVGNIFGDSDLCLESTEHITVSGRVTLDVLAKVQSETGILVHLCNLRGGQIPGKIYHYSATNKPILFILDGTDAERTMIRSYFEQFNRYYFCENNANAILTAMKQICEDLSKFVQYAPVEAFSPKVVVGQLLNK